MKQINLGLVLTLVTVLSSCALFKKDRQKEGPTARTTPAQQSTMVQTENKDQDASNRAASLTSGWPESSITAAKEMISRYGDPHETTSDSLIWRNVAPFKKVTVHREVYSNRFPLLHQNALEHVVDYKAPQDKVDDIWRYNGSVILDRTKGEMSSFGQSESMNILSLNLAHDIMTGRMSADAARITFGKETMKFLNGQMTGYTSVLRFGNQFQTADPGESVTNKIRWIGDPTAPRRISPVRQAQEEKKD